MPSRGLTLAAVRRRLSSVRTRFVVGYLILTSAAIGITMFVTYQLLVARADDTIDANLEQEIEELRQLADGTDPATGQPFGDDVARIFEVFLQRQVPARHETLLSIIDGEPYLRSSRTVPYRVDQDPELIDRWAGVERPERSRVATPAGRFDALAVPVVSDGEVLGVFVVGFFREGLLAEAREAVTLAGRVGALVLLLATGLAWSVATRVLAPVRAMTATAQRITDTDLDRRLEAEGYDELAELARTFNSMLDRLEEAFGSQREFVDDAGHELRTPITSIRGHLELLAEDPEDRRATVALVLDELDRMHRIVEDLILLAKAERPGLLHLDLVDLGALTRAVFEKASALADRQWLLGAAARGTVVADRQRLTQALLQLAQNATEHTANGAAIEIGSAFDGPAARLWIRDEGTGIAPEDRERIFARFARGSRGPRPSEGAGLGLAIVRTITEAHGGRVELDTALGRGSTFTLVIPVDRPPDERPSGRQRDDRAYRDTVELPR